MVDSYREEIIKDFAGELKSYIPRLQNTIDTLQNTTKVRGALKEIHRLVHSIKGASAVVGFKGLSKVAFEWEKALDDHFSGALHYDAAFKSEMEETLEVFRVYSDSLVNEKFDELDCVEERISAFEKLKVRSQKMTPEIESDLSMDELLNESEDEDEDFGMDFDVNALFENEKGDNPSVFPAPHMSISSVQRDLLEGFYVEADEYLDEVGRQLNDFSATITSEIDISDNCRESLMQIRRAVHTLKGAAAVIGLKEVSAWAHEVEDLLDYLYEEANQISPEIIRLLIESVDLLDTYVHHFESIETKIETRLKASFRKIIGPKEEGAQEAAGSSIDISSSEHEKDHEAALEYEKSSALFDVAQDIPPAASSLESSVVLPKKEVVETIRVDMKRIDQQTSVADELFINHSALDQRAKLLSKSLKELVLTRNRMLLSVRNLERDFEILTAKSFNPGIQSSMASLDLSSEKLREFDALELDRYSEFSLIIQMMKEGLNDIGILDKNIHGIHGDIEGLLNEQRLLLRDFKSDIERVRMARMSIIVNRLHRTVRETANSLNKSVKLKVEGEDIELDRRVWEKLTDPLMHLLRNAIDHGMESPKERIENNKDETGTITIRAAYKGDHILIEVSDDGCGIDCDAVFEQAKKNKIIDDGDELTDDEVLNLIFHPGITTKKTVSNVSGRGIGLDVVKENITALNGSVWTDSEKQEGTRFNLLIPLTIGSLRVILFSVSGQTYALPISEVEKAVRTLTVTTTENSDQTIVIDDEAIPHFDLSHYLPRAGRQKPALSSLKQNLMLIVKIGNWRSAISIEELSGEKEVVVKNLGTHLKRVKGIQGVTLSGGGQIIPILNIIELLSVEKEMVRESQLSEGEIEKEKTTLEVLIVDDSVSIREFTARTVFSKGWAAITARDGVNALEKLQENLPDIIILDIEMPRMNGFEVMNAIRSHPVYRHIPVIMLTSRAAKKHRDKAMDLGVQGYLVKPYKEEELIRLITILTGRVS